MATIEMAPDSDTTGEFCTDCGAVLARDQRYCLSCGARRSDPRVPFREVMERSTVVAGEDPRAGRPGTPARDWTPMIALGALGGLALVLLIGVLIGKTSFSGSKQASAPQVIRLGPSAATGASTGSPGTGATSNVSTSSGGPVKSDWPAGKQGYTVELGVLPKSTAAAAVNKAKSDAQSKGATGVGILDSDQFKSLPGGSWVIYSGVFSSQSQASAALKKLKGKFPNAQVIHVAKQAPKADTSFVGKAKATLNKQQLSNLNNLSGDQYSKLSRKLPTTTVLPGKPPPTDTKAPGGGSGGGLTIK